MFAHCHAVYRLHFSKKSVADQWDGELRGVLGNAVTHEKEASALRSLLHIEAVRSH